MTDLHKHVIMGTAGHIDHGKTALIRALTGIECDTHKEEKKRGITINLGFAHLDLPDGNSVGIVDVPGHRNFVHTMVGGAGGIDFALLVIAADSGVMPQTREHLMIMDIMNIQTGLIAVNKIDLVDPDIAELAMEEARDLVSGTFLESSPVIGVSAKDGQGIDRLKAAISHTVTRTTQKPADGVFRMYIDRMFSVSGFGSVVTGSVLSGRLKQDDAVYLLPGGKQSRIRRLEHHGNPVTEVQAGDRAAINLKDIRLSDLDRGMLLAGRNLRESMMLDAELCLFPNCRALGLWSQAVFHLGTVEQEVKIHLIEKDRMQGGETALVQFHLNTPCATRHGDRFVLRSTSSDMTIGGGTIIDPAPLHHRRRHPKAVEGMRTIARGEMREMVCMEVRKQHQGISHTDLALALNASEKEIRDILSGPLPGDIRTFSKDDHIYAVTTELFDRFQKTILRNITDVHKRNPLSENGRSLEELIGILSVEKESSSEVVILEALQDMQRSGILRKTNNTWALASHQSGPDSELLGRIEFISSRLKECGMTTPLLSDLQEKAGQKQITPEQLQQILQYLTDHNQAYSMEGNFIHASIVDSCRSKLLTYLADNQSGITVAGFRDLVSGNRKICLLLLNIYDQEGVTKRKDDVRIITDKGRKQL